MKKRIKKQIFGFSDDSWMYILLLSTLVILGESLKSYTFMFNKVELTYSLILLPVIFLLTNYITKKYDFQTTICAISASACINVIFIYMINFALGRSANLMTVGGGFCSYVIAQLMNLNIYKFLLENTKSPIMLIILNYIFSLIVFYMFYTLLNLNILVTDTYWKGYFTTIFIQTLECIILSIIDKKIKKGLEK